MIDLTKLNPSDRELLANSRFGALRPQDIPADWQKRIEDDLIERGVLESTEDDDPLQGDEL